VSILPFQGGPRSAEATLVDSADRLAPAEWNGLAGRGFHLHRWHQIAERCGWVPRHVVVRDAQGLRAVVPAWLGSRPELHDLHDRWLGPLRRLELLGVTLRPVLTVQSPYAQVSEPLGARLGPEALERVFELLEETADREGAKAVVWPFVETGQDSLIAFARERGYTVLYAGVTARLRIRWGSFEEYAASRSKAVRRTIRGDLAAFRDAGLRLTATSDFRAAAPAVEALYRQAYRRRNERDPRLPPGFFERLAECPQPGIFTQLTWSGERLVGCSINLAAGEVMEGTFAAFAPELQGGPAYLNDLVYAPVRVACRERIGAIDLGSSALYAKVLRGARLRRRMVLVRGTGPFMHRVLRRLGRSVARRQEEKERKMLGPLWSPGCYDDGDDDR
jgi:predicted N-acyltransferase